METFRNDTCIFRVTVVNLPVIDMNICYISLIVCEVEHHTIQAYESDYFIVNLNLI